MLVWHCTLHLQPVMILNRLPSILTKIGQLASQVGWSAKLSTLAMECDVSTITELLRLVCENAPSKIGRREIPSKFLCVASDASGNWGEAGVDVLGRKVLVQRPWATSLAHTVPICVLETLACVHTLEITCVWIPTLVFCLVDNTSAEAFLNNGFASHPLLDEPLEVLLALKAAGWWFRFLHITSAANPADEPSRNKPLDTGKCTAAERRINLEHLLLSVHIENTICEVYGTGNAGPTRSVTVQ